MHIRQMVRELDGYLFLFHLEGSQCKQKPQQCLHKGMTFIFTEHRMVNFRTQAPVYIVFVSMDTAQ